MTDIHFDTVPQTSSQTMRGVKGQHAGAGTVPAPTTSSTSKQKQAVVVKPQPQTPQQVQQNIRSEAAKHARDMFVGRQQAEYERAHAAPPAEKKAAVAETEQPEAAPAATGGTDPMGTRFERARAALKRGGWKDDEIAALPREQAIRRGLKLGRQHDRQAALHAEVERLRQSKEGHAQDVTAAAGTPSRVPPAPVDDSLPEPFAVYDDDEQKAIKDLLKARLSPLLEENAKLKAESSQRSSQGSEADLAMRLVKVCDKLSESIPDLADDDDRQLTLSVANGLKALDRFRGWETDDAKLSSMLTEAARLAELDGAGERDETDDVPQGAARGGFMDVTGGGTFAPQRRAPTNEAADAYQEARAIFERLGQPSQRDRILATLRRS